MPEALTGVNVVAGLAIVVLIMIVGRTSAEGQGLLPTSPGGYRTQQWRKRKGGSFDLRLCLH